MARITVEDCLPNVDNIFQLVLLAAARARRLANGAEATVPWENDKPTVVALREIAEGTITPEMLREPEPAPLENQLPDADNQSLFRAPQFGLMDRELTASDFADDDLTDEVEESQEAKAAGIEDDADVTDAAAGTGAQAEDGTTTSERDAGPETGDRDSTE